MAVVGNGLNYAVGLSRLGSVLMVIVVIGINLSFMMRGVKALKKVMNAVRL